MRNLRLLLLLTLSLPAFAQSVLTISPQQCVWRAGDDPAWAAPKLDESTWRPYSEWKSNPGNPHLWVRCSTDLTSMRNLEHPAIQITLYSAYQLYLDGLLISNVGNLDSGNFSMNTIRSFDLPQNFPASATIALRITDRSSKVLSNRTNAMLAAPLQINIGDPSLLGALRDHEKIVRSAQYFVPAVCFAAIGVAAVIMFGIYLIDRSRYELLLLSLSCLCLTLISLNQYASASLLGYGFSTYHWLQILGNVAGSFAEFPFFFVLVRRRVPSIIWILLAIGVLTWIPTTINVLVTVNEPAWLGTLTASFFRPLSVLSHTALSFSPFFAFWPFSGVPRRIRPIGVLCMLWGGAEIIWYGIEVTTLPALGMPDLFARWFVQFLDLRAFTTAGVLIALLVLLFREQQQVTEERALMAGELHAAREIQRMLAPASLDCVPNLNIDVAFHPMRDVGGDFYLCRILPDGTQRIVLGDVSGKGSAAAMTATLIIGAAAARDTDPPAVLLANLNRVMLESRVGGFATCLCADFAANGQVALANAGHLAPYLHGEEIAVPSGLPLGLNPQTADGYQPIAFTLPPGNALTFLSDGVVEARNTTGELFGFDRARAISLQPAEEIARAAKSFGQEDDITVLTLTRLAATPVLESTTVTFEPALDPVKF